MYTGIIYATRILLLEHLTQTLLQIDIHVQVRFVLFDLSTFDILIDI